MEKVIKNLVKKLETRNAKDAKIKIDSASPYRGKNGCFKLPNLPPNCFGLEVHYKLTSEDIENGKAAYGEDYDATEGETIVCGILTPRCTPYKKKQNIGVRTPPAQKDTLREGISLYDAGTFERMESLRAYYGNLSLEDDLLNSEEIESPFLVDMAKVISTSAIGKAFESYSHTEPTE